MDSEFHCSIMGRPGGTAPNSNVRLGLRVGRRDSPVAVYGLSPRKNLMRKSGFLDKLRSGRGKRRRKGLGVI